MAGFVRDSKRYETRAAELLLFGVFSKEKLVLGYCWEAKGESVLSV